MASTSSGDVNDVGDGRVTVKMTATIMKKVKRERGSTAKERISKITPSTAGKRTSIYRGVTRHRWTGRYEAHLWDKSSWNHNQNKKGKQGAHWAYDDEEAAARAYDLAALKYWGPGTLINFQVTDYSRDLKEMQNVSREDYLASLRRKSNGFSRGIAKYRALSSGRWEPSLRRASATEYLHGIHYGKGEDILAEGDYPGAFPIERKSDLTGYIKWWCLNKTSQLEVGMHTNGDEVGTELKSLEREVQSTKTYQLPKLGTSYEVKRIKGSVTSALSILTRSTAYKNMQEKASKSNETVYDDDEKENKCKINMTDSGNTVQIGRLGSALGIGGYPLHKNVFSLSQLLTTPLLTNYNSIEPLADSILWKPVLSVLPTTSRTSEVSKTDTSSTYSFFRQEEG
ncbi:unnamed protein product [Amaranthus hypochondriacus]